MSSSIPPAVIRQVAPHFEDATFARGRHYADDDRVHLVKADPWPVVARVRGTEGYVVTVRQSGHALHGDCSCRVAIDCKHAAAAALVALATDLARQPGRDLAIQHELVSKWLAVLNPRVEARCDETTRNVILYVLRRDGGTIGLTVAKSARLRRGGYSRAAAMVSRRDDFGLPQWVPTDDLRRIALLRAVSPDGNGNYLFATEPLDSESLRDFADTGRLFWQDSSGQPLRYGTLRRRPLMWQRVGDRDEYRAGICDPVELVAARDCHYLDPHAGVIGPLDLGVPAGLARALLHGPPVPESMLPTVRRSVAPLLADATAQRNLGPHPGDRELPTLRPHVCVDPDVQSVLDAEPLALARYGDDQFVLGEWDPARPVPRDLAVEGAYRARLERLIDDARPLCDVDNRGTAELAFCRALAERILPTLVSEGWTAELPHEFPYELAEVPTQWTETLRPTTGVDRAWFSFEIGVRVGDQDVSLLPLLLEAIERGDVSPESLARDADSGRSTGLNFELPDGRLVYVSGERVQRWVRPLIELRLRGLTDADELWVPTHTAVELDDDRLGRFGSEDDRAAAREHLSALVDLKPRREGRGFCGELRSYQRRGLAWLRFLHDAGYGGILADDLGLGKTVQLLAFIDGLRAAKSVKPGAPALVVAPRSVVGQWQAEARRFAPRLSSVVHLGPGRTRDSAQLRRAPLVMTSYQTLVRDLDIVGAIEWTTIVFDEAQALKNPGTKLRMAVAKLRSRSRFCVTGTPIENHLTELWSQLDVAMPGLLGRRRTFDAVIRRPIEDHGADAPLGFLRKRIRPFILRRRKTEVELELPVKTEILERVHLAAEQRDLYESVRLELDKDVRKALGRKVTGSSLLILEALLKLRQCCCDPRLVPLASARAVTSSAKLERLMAMLEDIADSGRAVLVFSQFASMLDIIAAECAAAGIATLTLTGATRQRDKAIAAFRAGAAPVFLISLKAGGSGLNLTRADTVIHYDPWWNPAVEDQASDRVHRIGQDKPVFVYRLIAAGTVEDRLLELQRDKRSRAEAVLSGSDATGLAKTDLEALYRALT